MCNPLCTMEVLLGLVVYDGMFLQNVMAIRSCLVFMHSVHDLMAKATHVQFCTGQSFA